MRMILLLLAWFYPVCAAAGIETDKKVGTCAAYMSLKQKERGARDALSLADSQIRALKFANLWLDRLKANPNNKTLVQAEIYRASSSCSDIGLRHADY